MRAHIILRSLDDELVMTLNSKNCGYGTGSSDNNLFLVFFGFLSSIKLKDIHCGGFIFPKLISEDI